MQRVLTGVLQIIIYFLPVAGVAQLVFEPKQEIQVFDGDQKLEIPWTGGLNSGQYNKADLDGDGREELIIYDRSANVYQIFRIDNEKIIPANELRVLLPDIPQGWTLFVDYDFDGKKDIFSNGDRGIVVFKNIGEPGTLVAWEKVADPLLTTGFSGKINLIANAADVPAITDIDSDGDVDILVYNFAIGGYIRYNKNLSQELYGTADSLEYEIETRSWGEFEECDCNLFTFNGETCEDISNGRVMHPGGKALLAIDRDGDGDKDLLVGHEQCIELYYYENMGDQDSAYMVDFSNMFPDDVHPANFYIFPAGYFEDLDFDGIRDLVVTPSFEENYAYTIDFGHSNWFYKNMGTNNNPDFVYQKNDLFQDTMLDFGENTVPAFTDLNADGMIDLLVASNGYWNDNEFSGQVFELSNTGNVENPSFKINDANYLNLTSLNIINPKISFVDFDGDSALDLVYSGMYIPNIVVSWLFINQAGPGQSVEYNLSNKEQLNLPESMTINDSPSFFDVDADGNVDLLLGKTDGALEYHRNSGGNTFLLADQAFLGIDRDFSLERRNLVASICDLDQNNHADLVATDSRGIGRVYFDFQSQVEGSYNSVDLVYENGISGIDEALKFDQKSWISSSDLFSKGSESIVVGGVRGGLQLFENKSTGSGGEEGSKLVVKIYPNPIINPSGLYIDSNQDVTIELISLLGQPVIKPFNVGKYMTSILDVGFLRNGTYILKSESDLGIRSSQLFMLLR